MAETVALTSVIGTVAVSIIGELRYSRCTHIDLGCMSCDRDVTDEVIKKGNRDQPSSQHKSSYSQTTLPED